MIKFLAVGMGGFIGANLRYGLSLWLAHPNGFPWATLTANMLGCFGLALFASGVADHVSANIRLIVATGFFGALTTFSTFNLEAITLYESGKVNTAALYVVASVILGWVAGAFGLAIGRGLTT